MASDLRGKILDEIFGRIPDASSAPTAPARPTRSSTGTSPAAPDGGTDTYEVVIADGACTLSPTRRARARSSPSPSARSSSCKLVSGSGNPMMMFMTGKLKAKGDLGLAANLANLFDIPKG